MNAGLPDVIAARLSVLFCGINPGLAAAATDTISKGDRTGSGG
jgi:hypothetical protein